MSSETQPTGAPESKGKESKEPEESTEEESEERSRGKKAERRRKKREERRERKKGAVGEVGAAEREPTGLVQEIMGTATPGEPGEKGDVLDEERITRVVGTFTRELGSASLAVKDLREAFSGLTDLIKEGTITVGDFNRAMEACEARLKKITAETQAFGSGILGLAEKMDNLGERVEDLSALEDVLTIGQDELRVKTAGMMSQLEAAAKGLRQAAEANAARGGAGMMFEPTAGSFKYESGDEDGFRENFDKKLAELEAMDIPFSQNWRLTWYVESAIASIPTDTAEGRELRARMTEEFDDRRRFHDQAFAHKYASGIEAVMAARTYLPAGVETRIAQKEGVADSMNVLQRLALDYYLVREELEQVTDQSRKKELTARKAALMSAMKDFMNGEMRIEIEDDAQQRGTIIGQREDRQGKLVDVVVPRVRLEKRMDGKGYVVAGSWHLDKGKIEDVRQAAAQRLTGKLFSTMGMMASYDIANFAGGDFFASRLMHMKKWLKMQEKRWRGREALFERFSNVKFTKKIAAGPWAAIPPHAVEGDKRKILGAFGLREVLWEEDASGRQLQVLWIEDLDRFGKMSLRGDGFRIISENFAVTEWVDAMMKADEFRKWALKPGKDNFFDKPQTRNLVEIEGRLEHLKGEARMEFMQDLVDGLIKFHRQPTFIERIKLTLQGKGGFIERYEVVDPDTGKVSHGYRYRTSVAQDMGLDETWYGEDVGENLKFLNQVNLITAEQREAFIRKYLGNWFMRRWRRAAEMIGVPGLLYVLFSLVAAAVSTLKATAEEAISGATGEAGLGGGGGKRR